MPKAKIKKTAKKTTKAKGRGLFGAHESIAGGAFTAIERGAKATCDTIQMFNKSNAQWKAKVLTDEEVEKYFQLQEETGVTVCTSHSSYLINIASPDKALNKKSYLALKEEMERCERLKIPNLVMHPGAHVGSGLENGMDTIVRNLNRLFSELKDNHVTLALETTAGQGSTIGRTFEELAYIIQNVEDPTHLGVCLDTCHIFAAGYDIRTTKVYKQTMKAFDDTIGIDRLRIIHANDSLKEFDSRRDRHEHIGKGFIGLDGFRSFVNDKRLNHIPIILETPKGDDLKEDIENLRVLRSLVK